MNAIIGMSDLLSRSELNGDQQDLLRNIQNSSESLLHLINDILDLSKIEAGRMSVHPEPCDIRHIANEAARLMHAQAMARGLSITCEISPDVPASIVADPVRLRQVLLNLTGNAVKFTNQGGVSVHIKRHGADGIRVEVVDTGIGLSPQAQTHLFQPFTQVERNTSHKSGTGLGLAISKRLVELMGGEIGVNSREGHGSTFWFTLPLQAAPQQDI
jgi:signal transduction histidine kinase